ncbi:MAG: GNAT family N-acetyltransferase [Paracoccaceae bacterium]
MTSPPLSPQVLAEVMEATWPPARRWQLGPFTLRDGAGGGQRVSAASCEGAFTPQELEAAMAAMADPLFLIRPGDDTLDDALERLGFGVHDPVVAYAAPVAALAGELPHLVAFPHWPPLEASLAVWVEGGIGPGRVAVMARARGAKTAILARSGDRPAGVCFVACQGCHAMLHALEVRPGQRRQGAGRHLLRAAANWAAEQGCDTLSLAVTARNAAARALYQRAGMAQAGQYHYRRKPLCP